MNLNQVTVQSRDIPESIAFYAALGLKLIVHSPHYARFECPEGDATFSVHLSGECTESSTVVYFEVHALEQTVAALSAKGLQFRSGPTRQPWLWYEARLLDPAGNEVCLYTGGENRKNPPWRIA